MSVKTIDFESIVSSQFHHTPIKSKNNHWRCRRKLNPHCPYEQTDLANLRSQPYLPLTPFINCGKKRSRNLLFITIYIYENTNI